jgi:hypothetical protein
VRSLFILWYKKLMKLSYALIAGALLWFVWTYGLSADGLHRFFMDAQHELEQTSERLGALVEYACAKGVKLACG